MPYRLGKVAPHVQSAAEDLGQRFGISIIHGIGIRPSGNSDHPRGLALDFMTNSKSVGDSLAAFLQANAQKYGVKYVIWWQKIWSPDRAKDGWRKMADRGSKTANHLDHVHVSFYPMAVPAGSDDGVVIDLPDVPNPIDTAKDVYDTLSAFAKVSTWLATPSNWLRMAMMFTGSALILIAIVSWDKVSTTVKNGVNSGRIASRS